MNEIEIAGLFKALDELLKLEQYEAVKRVVGTVLKESVMKETKDEDKS